MSTVDPVTRSSSLYAMNRIHSSDPAGRGPGEVGGRFDQVALSSEPTGTDRFRYGTGIPSIPRGPLRCNDPGYPGTAAAGVHRGIPA